LKKFKKLWENSFENIPKNSKLTSEKLVHHRCDVVLNQWDTMWKNELEKQTMHSDIYFVCVVHPPPKMVNCSGTVVKVLCYKSEGR